MTANPAEICAANQKATHQADGRQLAQRSRSSIRKPRPPLFSSSLAAPSWGTLSSGMILASLSLSFPHEISWSSDSVSRKDAPIYSYNNDSPFAQCIAAAAARNRKTPRQSAAGHLERFQCCHRVATKNRKSSFKKSQNSQRIFLLHKLFPR